MYMYILFYKAMLIIVSTPTAANEVAPEINTG